MLLLIRARFSRKAPLLCGLIANESAYWRGFFSHPGGDLSLHAWREAFRMYRQPWIWLILPIWLTVLCAHDNAFYAYLERIQNHNLRSGTPALSYFSQLCIIHMLVLPSVIAGAILYLGMRSSRGMRMISEVAATPVNQVRSAGRVGAAWFGACWIVIPIPAALSFYIRRLGYDDPFEWLTLLLRMSLFSILPAIMVISLRFSKYRYMRVIAWVHLTFMAIYFLERLSIVGWMGLSFFNQFEKIFMSFQEALGLDYHFFRNLLFPRLQWFTLLIHPAYIGIIKCAVHK